MAEWSGERVCDRGVVMTMLAPSRRAKPPKHERPEQEHVVLAGVSWDTYSALLNELDGQNIRLTYDDGMLEISVPLPLHEKYKSMLGRMVELLSLERDIPISSFGSTTFRTKKFKKGTEPDECYYVQSEPKVRGKVDLDLKQDPAPDLAIEVEITSPSVSKLPIYAALGVAEVWRFDGTRLQSLHRTPAGEYVPHDTSLAFPFLKMADVERIIRRLPTTDEMSVIRAWRDWLQRKPGRRRGK